MFEKMTNASVSTFLKKPPLIWIRESNRKIYLQEKYLSEHNYDEPIDVDSTLKLLNFGDDYSKFIDSMSDEFSDLDPATVKPQRTKRKIRRQSTVNTHTTHATTQ